MADLKHGEEQIVAFLGSTARMFDGTKYYRLTFRLNGNFYSVKSAEDKAGYAGIVRFVAKGTEFERDGKKVKAFDDSFTLITTLDKTTVDKAKENLASLKLEDLD